MTTKQLLTDCLKQWQLPVTEEDDNAIAFPYEMDTVHAIFKDDTNAIALELNDIFTADNAGEFHLALMACNQTNNDIFLAKCYIGDNKDLSVRAEYFHTDATDFGRLLRAGLNAIRYAQRRFIHCYQAMEKMHIDGDDTDDDDTDDGKDARLLN